MGATLAYRTTREQLQHPPLSRTQWSMLQSPNDLWAVLVWIPLKLHYSYKLQAINPLLKILTSLILEESCGFPHHRTDSYDMKLRDRMCCVEFSMQTDKSTASVVFTIYGFEHAKIKRLLLLPLLQTVDQNLILHNPIHTKNITQQCWQRPKHWLWLHLENIQQPPWQQNIKLLFLTCQTASSQRRSTKDEVLSLRFKQHLTLSPCLWSHIAAGGGDMVTFIL